MGEHVELRSALEGVEGHHVGSDLTVNSVLAAHLRAVGVTPSGAAWRAAKDAITRGHDFYEAALEGLRFGRAGGPAANRVADASAGHAQPSPSGTTMEWFPKQFGPGDIDGLGARRLLGTPSIEPAWVLVRETGQNSWDARGASNEIEFVLNLRQLSAVEISVLAEDVFRGGATGTGVGELFEAGELWVLEVSDRGTVGLGGPVRNDRTVATGVATDFIDLVFNIGAPRDVHLGGGTYGFGKTISYSVSSVGSILLWSRPGTDLDGDRLIGSAIGDSFDRGGRRYTGRHWWGRALPAEDRVEPLVGTVARDLAQRVFTGRFEGMTPGTSIMILDPKFGGQTREEDAERLVQAVLWNLWPKLLGDHAGRNAMQIRVQLNGIDLPIPDVETHPVLGGHAACLQAVRAVQGGKDAGSASSGFPTEVVEVRSNRPNKLLGHLALCRYPYTGPASHPFDGPSHHVALMRHEAELVVRYLDRQPFDTDGLQWAGVFKPVESVDDSFAMAEPPAHDDWVPASVPDKSKRRDVNVGLREIRSAVDRFIRPTDVDRKGRGDLKSAAVVGDMLSDLVGGLEGSGPTTRTKPTGSGGKRVARPKVDIIWSDQEARDDGWTVTRLDVQLSGAGAAGATVDIRARVGFDGGSEEDPEVLRGLGWGDESDTYVEAPVWLASGETRRYVIESRPDIAVDVETVVVDG